MSRVYLFVVMLIGCSENEEYKFLENDFSPFKGYVYYIRSIEGNQKTIFGSPIHWGGDVGPVVFYVMNDSLSDVSTHLVRNMAPVNIELMGKLAVEFNKLEVSYLEVDSLENVFVGTRSNESIDMIKIIDSSGLNLHSKYNFGETFEGWNKVQEK